MKIIKISTDLELTVHDFPEGNYSQQNHILCELIGNHCSIYERVTPKRLYSELQMKCSTTNVPGECVCMLVDEEGLLKEIPPNLIGSYLYETDIHKQRIVGNILFVGEVWEDDGIGFCGIDDRVLVVLEQKLSDLIHTAKEVEEEPKE